ncbi:MAG: monovalent cation/H+ antiporter subunit D family protein [Sneathiellaceae bacterium]
MPDYASLVIAAPLIPLVGAALIALLHRVPNLREAASLVTAALLAFVVLQLLAGVLDGARPAVSLIEVLPGVGLAFSVEPLGMLFATIAGLLWLVNTLYSIGYMRGNAEKRQTVFYVCFALALASTMGIAFSGNLFTLFIFYELLTLTTVPLVTHKANEEAVRAGRVYLGILMGSSVLLFLSAIIWTYVAAGTVDFRDGGILAGVLAGLPLAALLALFAWGIGKAALMPLHAWLPAAMVAPTPVSALLHAVAVVKAGVFCIVKVIVYIFGIDLLAATVEAQWLVYVAGTSVVLASLIAMRQDNLKRRLAYSTISQLSYVVMAAAMFSPLAILGAAMHIAAHAFGKITLFFVAGSIYTAAHKTQVSELAGIGRRMPWTMGAFAIGTFSMIGLPLTVGFLSKWYMLQAAVQETQIFVLAVLFLSTILNAAYFIPILYIAFLRRPPDGAPPESHGEAPWPIVVALCITAAGAVLLFFYPDVPLALTESVAQSGGGAGFPPPDSAN